MKKFNVKKNINIGEIIKSSISSILTTLICILIFAFVLNIFNLGNESIDVVNQIIKIVSIIIGCTLLNKNTKNSKITYYIILPLLYTLLTYIIFSILNKSFSLDITLFNDMFFGVIVGCIYYLLIGRKQK